MPGTTQIESLGRWHDFSLVLGGPLYQILRKAHLEGDHLELLRRRLIVVTAIAWLPLLLLSLLGTWTNRAEHLSFLQDVEVHVRFLIALPILIAAERIVHLRVRPVVHRFIQRRIISTQNLPRFENAIDSAMRLRDSVLLECALLVFIYTVGLWVWNSRVEIGTETWYLRPGGRWNLTPAGFWYVFVSIPLLQFVLLRWYLRIFIWFRFLWQVSRIDLHLVPTHPDRSAGLAFLGRTAYAFSPVLVAQGVMLAGLIASRVLYNGEKLASFKLQAGGFIVFFVIAILGPLLMFTPQMAAAKRKGLADYGQLAQDYVDRFEQRWVLEDKDAAPPEELLGAADIQSLADLGNSYGMVRDMRPVPFGLQDITRLAAATAAPLVPLLFTVFSPEEVIARIIKVIF